MRSLFYLTLKQQNLDLMEILILVLYVFSAIDAMFPRLKELNPIEILILATVILSAIIAILFAIISLFTKKNVLNSFDLFMYSFLGGLMGGLIGTIIGFALGYLVALIIPSSGDFMFSDLNKAVGLVVVLFVCWLIGVIAGAITTIKPVIKFFSNS